jgi:hypothetical protein
LDHHTPEAFGASGELPVLTETGAPLSKKRRPGTHFGVYLLEKPQIHIG